MSKWEGDVEEVQNLNAGVRMKFVLDCERPNDFIVPTRCHESGSVIWSKEIIREVMEFGTHEAAWKQVESLMSQGWDVVSYRVA